MAQTHFMPVSKCCYFQITIQVCWTPWFITNKKYSIHEIICKIKGVWCQISYLEFGKHANNSVYELRFVLKTKNTSITFVLFIHSKLFKLNRFEYVFNWIKELRIQFIQTSDQLKRSHWFLIFDCYYFSKFHKIFSLYFHYYIFYSSHGLLLLFCIYEKMRFTIIVIICVCEHFSDVFSHPQSRYVLSIQFAVAKFILHTQHVLKLYFQFISTRRKWILEDSSWSH